jgi:PAS domain S-box-containing protein
MDDATLSDMISQGEVIDQLPVGVAIFDRQYELRRCNPAWAEAVARDVPALSESEVAPGMSLFALTPTPTTALEDLLGRVLAGRTIRQRDFAVGGERAGATWDVTWQPLTEDGETMGLVAVLCDVHPLHPCDEAPAEVRRTLRAPVDRLSLVMQATNDGIWDWNIRTNTVYYSPRWKQMLGYEDEELPNHFDTWQNLIHPEDVARAQAELDAYLAGETKHFELEYRLRHKDGAYRWVLARGVLIRDVEGEPCRAVGSHTDITPLKDLQQNLQHMNAFQNLLTATSTQFINIALEDVDESIQQALQEVGEFTNVDRSYVFLYADDKRRMTCTHEWCAPGVAPHQDLLQNIPVDALSWSNEILFQGEVLHIPRVAELPPTAEAEREEFESQGIQSLLATPMVYQGETIGLLGFDAVRAEKEWTAGDIRLLRTLGAIFINALERKRADEALRESQRILSTLISNLPGMAYRCRDDAEWTMLFVSQGSLELTGYPPEELVGSHELTYGQLIHPDDKAMVREDVRAALRERRHFEIIYRILTPHEPEGEKWVWERGQGVYAADGELTAVEGFITDITERVMSRQHLEQRVEERTDELQTLLSVQQAITSRLDAEAVLQMVVDEGRRLTSAQRAVVWMLDGDMLEIAVIAGKPGLARVAYRAPRDQAPGSECLHTGEPCVLHQLSEWPINKMKGEENAEGREGLNVQSLVSVPLISGDNLLGMITAAEQRPDAFGPETVRMLQGLASSAAIALENARLYREEQAQLREAERRREVAEGMRDILAFLNSNRPLDAILDYIMAEAQRLLGASAGLIYQLQDGGETAHIEAVHGLPDELREFSDVPLYIGSSNRAISENRPFVIPNFAEHLTQEVPDMSILPPAGVAWLETLSKHYQAHLNVPLIVRDKVYGGLQFYYPQPRAFTEDEIELGLTLGDQISLAIENARLYAESRRRAEENQALLNVQQAIMSDLNMDAVLQMIASEARRLTGVQRSVVLLLDEIGEELVVRHVAGEETLDLEGQTLSVQDSVSGRSMLAGEPVLITDMKTDDRATPETQQTTRYRSQISVPLITSDGPLGLIAVSDPAPNRLDEDDVHLMMMFASSAVIGLENARLYQEEQNRREEAEQRRRVAEGLRDILAVLNSNCSFDEVLDYIVYQASELLGARAGVIYRVLDDQNTIFVEAASGAPTELANLGQLPNYMEQVNRSLARREPFAVSDLPEEVTTDLPTDLEHLDPALIRWKKIIREHYRAYLAVPLLIEDHIYGALVLYYSEPRAFSEEDRGLGMALGGQVALAIENARLRDQVEEAAVAAERHRLARDLHDAVSQTLFSASIIADVLPRLWEMNPDEAMRRLNELRELTRGALAEMRMLLVELRPTALVESNFSELLHHLTTAFTGKTRVPVELDISGQGKFPPDVQVALYRIAQEALNNIVKHAQPTHVYVSMHIRADQAILRIQDDGQGFNPDAVPAGHFGIGNMRERASGAGIRLRIESTLGEGAQIEAVWQPH